MGAATETAGAPAAPRGARRRIGVGVIGFGWLGQAHSRSLLRIPTLFGGRDFDAELVICGDTLPERRDDAVRSFGFARSTADWRAVIDDPDVDVVFIAAPNMLHVELVEAAAEAGKHVFCLVDGEDTHFNSPREAKERGIATVFQDLATVPLMSIWRNFFLGSEPTKGKGPLRRVDIRFAQDTMVERNAQDGHRRPRPRPTGRHALGRRAPGGGDRARGVLRSQGPDPRRADLGAGRQAVRRRPSLCRRRRASAGSASSSSRTTRTTPSRSATAS